MSVVKGEDEFLDVTEGKRVTFRREKTVHRDRDGWIVGMKTGVGRRRTGFPT